MSKIILSLSFIALLSACSADSNNETPDSAAKPVTQTSTDLKTTTANVAMINIQSETASAKQAIAKFAGELKTELMAAMQSSGPMKALSVCNHKAPAITAHMSDVHGKQLSRVSLKTRNSNNAPEDWQRSVLEDFEARHAMGEDASKMVYAEIVSNEGKRQFRFMKAIPTDNACLICHGRTIAPKLKQRISELYPKDQAIDFEYGDIRGAFVVVNNLAK